MAVVNPPIPPGTASLPNPLITPGWPFASVPGSNPIAVIGSEDAVSEATEITAAVAQTSNTTGRVV